MKPKFIFDVDGTLTPSRMMMNKAFEEWFITFCSSNDVYIVTGSDKNKTFGQIGGTVYNAAKRVYQCQGNQVWEGEELIRSNEIKISEDLQELLDKFLIESEFPYRAGNHIEVRTGLVNFSIVGRNATVEQRQEYIKWDLNTKERFLIADMLSQSLPEYTTTVAGETGIDIVRTGSTKKQILKDFSDEDKIIFFGDSCYSGGNDHDIAHAVLDRKGVVYQVNDWVHTWQTCTQWAKK